MLSAHFSAAASTVSLLTSLIRPTSEYISISEAGFSRVPPSESTYRFAASLTNCEYSLFAMRHLS